MEHLRGLFQLSEHANCKLAWLECGSKYKDLLTVVSDSGRLHYSKLSGNTDAGELLPRSRLEQQSGPLEA